MSNIEGKSAIVTGATRGIGLAIARAFLQRRARVFICARTGADVERTVSLLREQYGDRIRGAACDVRSFDQVHSMFTRAVETLNGLDILINNAGIGSRSYVADMPVEEWDSTVQTNLSGVFYCSHEALPLMKQRGGGYIISIGSLAGTNAFPGGAAYCATKFALIGFSEALMQEVRYDHIRVSYVMPGSVNTSFGRSDEQGPAASWKLTPEDVAVAVINLIEMDPRALASRIEIRPSEPKPAK
jgi:NAD(P)-dependent dehydrogenase (short-subunit alcohol dehydrogenase family)